MSHSDISVESNRLGYTNFLLKYTDERIQVGIWQNKSYLLINKLVSVSVHGYLFPLLNSYLSGRSQCVTINGHQSWV